MPEDEPEVKRLAPVQRVMAQNAQNSYVGRNIEPASGARDYVMRFEAFFSAAPLTTTVTMQDERPQLPPAPCLSTPGRHNHVTTPDFDMTAPLNSTGAGRRACSPAASNKAAAASSLERLASILVTFAIPSLLITRFV